MCAYANLCKLLTETSWLTEWVRIKIRFSINTKPDTISIDVSTFGQVNFCDGTMLKMLRLVDLMETIIGLMQGQCKIFLTMFPFGRGEAEKNSLSCEPYKLLIFIISNYLK